jgi:hypothetical protein
MKSRCYRVGNRAVEATIYLDFGEGRVAFSPNKANPLVASVKDRGRFASLVLSDAPKNSSGESMRKILISASFALALSPFAASAQAPLASYADDKGYVDVQKLTCAQLAGTFQEDADFLGVWYSG